MQIVANDQLAEELLSELMAEIDDNRNAEGRHPSVTDLIYCLTKSYYQAHDELKLDFSFQTKLYFLIGLGLERALLVARKGLPTAGEFDGIYYHLDSIDKGLLELKSTRTKPGSDIPDKHKIQMMAYCKVNGLTECDYAVVHLIKPDFLCYRVSFTNQEIEDNWHWIKTRKKIWDAAELHHTPPQAFATSEVWECRSCNYLIVCDRNKRMGL